MRSWAAREYSRGRRELERALEQANRVSSPLTDNGQDRSPLLEPKRHLIGRDAIRCRFWKIRPLSDNKLHRPANGVDKLPHSLEWQVEHVHIDIPTPEVETALAMSGGEGRASGISKSRVRARVTEFGYPPVHDALVLGSRAPLGAQAFRKAVDLLVASPFEDIHLQDDVVGSILARTSIMRRIGKEQLVDFVLRRVKPLMSAEEILHLDLEIEVELDDDER